MLFGPLTLHHLISLIAGASSEAEKDVDNRLSALRCLQIISSV